MGTADLDQVTREERMLEMSPAGSEKGYCRYGGPEAGVGLACSWKSKRFCHQNRAGGSGLSKALRPDPASCCPSL